MAWSLREFKGAALLRTPSSARAAGIRRQATPILARRTQPISPTKINPGQEPYSIRLRSLSLATQCRFGLRA